MHLDINKTFLLCLEGWNFTKFNIYDGLTITKWYHIPSLEYCNQIILVHDTQPSYENPEPEGIQFVI